MDFEQEFEVIPVTRVKITDTEAYSKASVQSGA